LSIADCVKGAGTEPMSMEAIQAEVQAARQERRGRLTHDAVVAVAEEFILEDVAWGLRGQDWCSRCAGGHR
jgi:hypothetical protein